MDAQELQAELAALEAKEARLSRERRRLHDQIDFGFETPTTRARERQISEARLDVHRQIDALRELIHGKQPA